MDEVTTASLIMGHSLNRNDGHILKFKCTMKLLHVLFRYVLKQSIKGLVFYLLYFRCNIIVINSMPLLNYKKIYFFVLYRPFIMMH